MIALDFQNILLWRHADALPLEHPNSSDIARPLSKKGLKQAEKMADWVLNALPENTLIVSSNAVRAEQTVQSLELDYLVFASLAPNATLDTVLDTLSNLPKNNLPAENLLVIGHQPWLGLLAAQLLNAPQPLPKNATEYSIKKGAVLWFKQFKLQGLRQSTAQKKHLYRLHAAQVPSLI